jgi:hypothetical protein
LTGAPVHADGFGEIVVVTHVDVNPQNVRIERSKGKAECVLDLRAKT